MVLRGMKNIFFDDLENSYGVLWADVLLFPPVKTEGYLQAVPMGQAALRKALEWSHTLGVICT